MATKRKINHATQKERAAFINEFRDLKRARTLFRSLNKLMLPLGNVRPEGRKVLDPVLSNLWEVDRALTDEMSIRAIEGVRMHFPSLQDQDDDLIRALIELVNSQFIMR